MTLRSLPALAKNHDAMAANRPAAKEAGDAAGRLVGVRQAAAYLGLSVWTIRDLIRSGHLPRVALPGRRPGQTMRRVFIDRSDLEALVERSRETAPRDPPETLGRQQRVSSEIPRRKVGQLRLPARTDGRVIAAGRELKPLPIGDALDVTPTDVRQCVDLEGSEGDYWTVRMRNCVTVTGLFRCCLKQIAHYEHVRGPKIQKGTVLPCPFCGTEIGFRGCWERR
jgi:excisionase family DNA binding protein